MTKKLLLPILMFSLIIGSFVLVDVQSVGAQATSFPPGCGSALGYSASTGEPCNGTSTATLKFMPGCTSALGYSATTGEPCSGASFALQWMAGCTSVLGYSAISGEPCNGTLVATLAFIPPLPPTVPGLPTTGMGGNATMNGILLLSSAIAAALASVYVVRARSLAR